jgi:hypothetical protein
VSTEREFRGVILGKPVEGSNEVEIQQWFPTPDASGPPAQVHICFPKVRPHGAPPGAGMILRLKSREGAIRFLEELRRNVDEVWPP